MGSGLDRGLRSERTAIVAVWIRSLPSRMSLRLIVHSAFIAFEFLLNQFIKYCKIIAFLCFGLALKPTSMRVE